ncbi:MAG: hypothetical protein MUP70_08950 [Candidatus Aminicenantes bacterium]|nr:hypothetical protein [Candidatus Aminicenantes bacterium]
MKKNLCVFMTIIFIFAASVLCLADVVQESTVKMIFKGPLGTAMKILGASKPIQSAVYYKGNLMRTDTMDKKGNVTDSQIIDLDREVMINIQYKKKSYTEMTFAEWRALMESRAQQPVGSDQRDDVPKGDWSFKVDVDRPGESKNIAGYDTEKVVLTLTAEGTVTDEEDPTKSYKGKMIVTADMWMTEKQPAGVDEMKRFQLDYAKKLGFDFKGGDMTSVLEQLSKNNEQLVEALEKLQKEQDKLSGFALQMNTVFATEGAPPQPEASSQSTKKRLGGLVSRLKKKVLKSGSDQSGPTVLMEMEVVVQKFDSGPVDAGLFPIPAGFKKIENK